MPMLAMRCDDCGEVFEELVIRSADADSITCVKCGGKVERHYQGKALFRLVQGKQSVCDPIGGCGHAGTGCGFACQR